MPVPLNTKFDREKGTLLLEVDTASIDVPPHVVSQVEELGLHKKQESHITILGFGAGQRIMQAISGNSLKLGELASLAEETDWTYEPKEEFYEVEKSFKIRGIAEDRATVIMMVSLPKLEEFMRRAGAIAGIQLEVPPAHITLYSKSTLQENMEAGIGIGSQEDFRKLKPHYLMKPRPSVASYKEIALPTRPQPDTIVAIFILKQFGEEMFPGVSTAKHVFLPRIPEGETEEGLIAKGTFLFDVGGGMFDHHNKSLQTTASSLIAEYLGQKDNPALTRLLQYAERDDFYGKGTISIDPLDRAFGLSGLIGSLNKKYVKDPEKVIEIVLPLVDAFYEEERKRAFDMPQELEEKKRAGRAQEFSVRQRGKNLKCILIETDNTSMAGYLRSRGGGGYDVVAIRLPSGHTNILTRQLQNIDLRSLALLIRIQEVESRGAVLEGDPQALSATGTIPEVPQWYYDPATNSLLNGGPNPQGVEPTSIDAFEMAKTIEVGISEQLWAPAR